MDKLTILNDALAATANTRINVLNDGSDEWQMADNAFERAIRDLVSRHKWPFARARKELVPGEENPSERYDYGYALPAACLHLKGVYVDGCRTEEYEVSGRILCLNAASDVSIDFIAAPSHAAWHPQAAEILTRMVEVGLLRGLNEDFSEADRRERQVELRLLEARPYIDGQNPARNAYRSNIAQARRTRKGGWGRGAVVESDGIGSGSSSDAGSVLLD